VKALYILVIPAFALQTWILYLAVMALKRERDAMPRITRALGYIVLGVGYVFDVAFNLLASIPFAEPPRELLFTARVHRHINEMGYRGNLARWFCANLLEPFDKGHCT
jgi:hypothetical protein